LGRRAPKLRPPPSIQPPAQTSGQHSQSPQTAREHYYGATWVHLAEILSRSSTHTAADYKVMPVMGTSRVRLRQWHPKIQAVIRNPHLLRPARIRGWLSLQGQELDKRRRRYTVRLRRQTADQSPPLNVLGTRQFGRTASMNIAMQAL